MGVHEGNLTISQWRTGQHRVLIPVYAWGQEVEQTQGSTGVSAQWEVGGSRYIQGVQASKGALCNEWGSSETQ